MDSVTLTPTFANSFWSRDYRHGFEVLYDTLGEALEESESISSFIRARISVEDSYARYLSDIGTISEEAWETEDGNPRVETSKGILHERGGMQLDRDLGRDLGRTSAASSSPSLASLGSPLVITALASANAALATAHAHMASALTAEALNPLVETISLLRSHLGRSRETLEAALEQFETQSATVARVKAAYVAACRECDVMEDEMRFVGANHANRGGGQGGEGTIREGGGESTKEGGGESTKEGGHESTGGQEATQKGVTGTMPETTPDVTRAGDGFAPRDEVLAVSTGGASVVPAAHTSRGAVSAPSAPSDSTRSSRTVPATDTASPVTPLPYSTFPPTEYDSDSSEGLSDAPTLTHALTRRLTRLTRLTRDALPVFSALSPLPHSPRSAPAALAHARTRAAQSEAAYRREVAVLDEIRLALEQNLDAHFAYAQTCETRRVVALASALHAYARLAPDTRVSAVLPLLSPARAVRAAIERRRTGPFVPTAVVFEPHYAEPYAAAFGAELRGPGPGLALFSALLAAVRAKAAPLSRAARRRAWLLETPLKERHVVRRRLNAAPPRAYSAVLEPVNVVLSADTLKLWLLELPTPVVVYSHYEEYRGVYPRVGATEARNEAEREPREASDSNAGELGGAGLAGEWHRPGGLYPLKEAQLSGDTQRPGERAKTNREHLGPSIGTVEHSESAKHNEPVSDSSEGAALHDAKSVSARLTRVSRQLSYLPVEHYHVLKELIGYLSGLYRERAGSSEGEGEGHGEEGRQEEGTVPYRAQNDAHKNVSRGEEKNEKTFEDSNIEASTDAAETVSPTLRVSEAPEKRQISQISPDPEDTTFLAKLSLSLSRCIIRPKTYTALTLDDRFPVQLVADLIAHYDLLFSEADSLRQSLAVTLEKPKRKRSFFLSDKRGARQAGGPESATDNDDRYGLSVTAPLLEGPNGPKLSDKQGDNSFSLSDNTQTPSDVARRSSLVLSDALEAAPHVGLDSKMASGPAGGTASTEKRVLSSSDRLAAKLADRLSARRLASASEKATQNQPPNATDLSSPESVKGPSETAQNLPLESQSTAENANGNIKIATQHLGVTLQDIPLDSPIHRLQNVEVPQNIQESTQDEKKKLTIATSALDSDRPPLAFPSPL